jgi:hypothetical protein
MVPSERGRMSAGGTLNHALRPMIWAISSLFSGLSAQRWASSTACSSAAAALGWASIQSARSARLFSGWSFQISPVVQAE